MRKAAVNIAPGEDERTSWMLGELVINKVPSQITGGAYALFEVATPAGAGAPPHLQHREDESFYVLEGEYEFQIEGPHLEGEDGIPSLRPQGHTARARERGCGRGQDAGKPDARGLYERFFEKVGTLVDGEAGPLTEEAQLKSEKIAAIGVEYGNEIPLRVAQRGRA